MLINDAGGIQTSHRTGLEHAIGRFDAGDPLFLHESFRRLALQDPKHAFGLATRLHAVALTVSAVAIGAGVLGAHGALW